jgi:hypothetical protein
MGFGVEAVSQRQQRPDIGQQVDQDLLRVLGAFQGDCRFTDRRDPAIDTFLAKNSASICSAGPRDRFVIEFASMQNEDLRTAAVSDDSDREPAGVPAEYVGFRRAGMRSRG